MNNSKILQKSHPKSFFKVIQPIGQTCDFIFSKKPHFDSREVVVLQVMEISNRLLLVELVDEDQYSMKISEMLNKSWGE